MTDDLHAPLGQKKKPVKRHFPFVKTGALLANGLLVLSLLGFAGWSILVEDPLGGEPIAIANADVRVQLAAKKPDDASVTAQATGVIDLSKPDGAAPAPPPGSRLVTIIDGTNGKRQNIIVPEFDEKKASPEERLVKRPRLAPTPNAGPDGPRSAKAAAAKQYTP